MRFEIWPLISPRIGSHHSKRAFVAALWSMDDGDEDRAYSTLRVVPHREAGS